jgi:hypothetical protein
MALVRLMSAFSMTVSRRLAPSHGERGYSTGRWEGDTLVCIDTSAVHSVGASGKPENP